MMPTMQEIDETQSSIADQTGSFFGTVQIKADKLHKLCAAARRGVEAEAEIAQLRRVIERGRDSTRTELLLSEQLAEQRAGNIKLLERAEKAEAELAALKMERLALARECIDAWENAVDWSSYASEYFREKHGADKDQDKLDNARDRLAMLELQAEREPALKAAQTKVVVPVGVVVGLSANPWNVIVRCSSEKRPALDTPVYLHPHPEQPERVSVPVSDEQINAIMSQAQVFASSWAIAGSRFDSGSGFDDAEEAKNDLRQMITSLLSAAQEGK